MKSFENRLGKDADLRERYAQTIKDDLEKGYVKTVEPSESQKRSKREWYLPHHPVLNPNKPGKTRRVLNGAALFHKQSLNSALMAGPDLLQNLLYIILKFRQHRYTVSADIEGMFLQVGVPDKDQTSLPFCGGRTPLKKWLCTNIPVIYSVPKTPRPEQTMRYKEPQTIIARSSLEQPEMFGIISTWTTTWNPLLRPKKQRKGAKTL